MPSELRKLVQGRFASVNLSHKQRGVGRVPGWSETPLLTAVTDSSRSSRTSDFK